jgi:PHD/YefM family antitoxin component YafN of YafNO toxin-antitoxin module
MSDNASDSGKEKGNGTGDSEYLIDETVTLDDEDTYESWDLEVDPSTSEEYILRSIGRSNNTSLRAYLLPKEEFEHFENDENVWWEYRSTKAKKISDSFTVSNEDEDPYKHSGDYVLAIEVGQGRSTPENPKFSVKLRRE